MASGKQFVVIGLGRFGQSVAMQLAEGNYQAKCNIKQKDEVGELAYKVENCYTKADIQEL